MTNDRHHQPACQLGAASVPGSPAICYPARMSSDPLLKWRSEFPILEKKRGYLINNSLGAMPRKVYDGLKAYADLWATEGVVAWHDWLPLVASTADMLGRIFNAPPGTTMMHQNVATLTSVVASALDFSGKKN